MSTAGLKKASHPDTGEGWTIAGVKDAHGRPLILSKGGAAAFKQMMADSGGQVKGSDIASAQRSRSKNTAVGGHYNSSHLYGEAVDVSGSSLNWLQNNAQKYGWKYGYSHGPGSAHYNYKGKKSGGFIKGGAVSSYDKFMSLQQQENMHSQDMGPAVIHMGDDEGVELKMQSTGGAGNNLPQYLNTRCSSIFAMNYRFDERSYNVASYT